MALTKNSVVIANNTTQTSAISVGGGVVVGIDMPAAFTGTTLTAEHSLDGGVTWRQLYTPAGAAYSITVVAGKYIQVPASDLAGVDTIRFISGSTETPARTLTVVTRPV